MHDQAVLTAPFAGFLYMSQPQGVLPRIAQQLGVQPGMLRHFEQPWGLALSHEAGFLLRALGAAFIALGLVTFDIFQAHLQARARMRVLVGSRLLPPPRTKV